MSLPKTTNINTANISIMPVVWFADQNLAACRTEKS